MVTWVLHSKLQETIVLAEAYIQSSMEGIVEELEALCQAMKEILESSESLTPVTSSDLDQETVDLAILKNMYAKHGNTGDGAKFYVTFNKTRALRTLAEKFFKDAEAIFGNVNARAMCPHVFDAMKSCTGKVAALDMQTPERVIANLTSLTSLFRPLQPGETRNLLCNKSLTGFTSMKLRPALSFLGALAKHATPDLYQTYSKFYKNAEKWEGQRNTILTILFYPSSTIPSSHL